MPTPHVKTNLSSDKRNYATTAGRQESTDQVRLRGSMTRQPLRQIEVGVSVKTIPLGHATRVTDAFLGICLGHGLPGPRVIRFFLRLRLFGSVSFCVPRFRNQRPFLRGRLTRRRLTFLPLCTSLIKSDVSKCILMVFDVY